MDLQPYSSIKSFQTHWARIFNCPVMMNGHIQYVGYYVDIGLGKGFLKWCSYLHNLLKQKFESGSSNSISYPPLN